MIRKQYCISIVCIKRLNSDMVGARYERGQVNSSEYTCRWDEAQDSGRVDVVDISRFSSEEGVQDSARMFRIHSCWNICCRMLSRPDGPFRIMSGNVRSVNQMGGRPVTNLICTGRDRVSGSFSDTHPVSLPVCPFLWTVYKVIVENHLCSHISR